MNSSFICFSLPGRAQLQGTATLHSCRQGWDTGSHEVLQRDRQQLPAHSPVWGRTAVLCNVQSSQLSQTAIQHTVTQNTPAPRHRGNSWADF